jgi:hypothetical protein
VCMLSFIASGEQPDLQHLHNGAAVNRDGYGYAIATSSGTLIVRKSIKADPLIEEFGLMRAKHPHGPAMFHSRLGTGGRRGIFNCHPFFVGGDNLTVVAHNGILWGHNGTDHRCDTRAFAEGLLPMVYANFDEYSLRRVLEQWLGFNKLVILTVNPKYQQTGYIFNEDRGRWVGGTWHSNSDYMHRSYSRPATRREPAASSHRTLAGVRCEMCLRRDCIDRGTNKCTRCGGCNDCLEPQDACLCHLAPAGVPLLTKPGRLALTAGTENST